MSRYLNHLTKSDSFKSIVHATSISMSYVDKILNEDFYRFRLLDEIHRKLVCIQVSILEKECRELKGIDKTSGKAFDFTIQTGYALFIGDQGALHELPERFEFTLQAGQQPYECGFYNLSPDSIFCGDDGFVEFSKILLLA